MSLPNRITSHLWNGNRRNGVRFFLENLTELVAWTSRGTARTWVVNINQKQGILNAGFLL